jgi:hypothetical protein
MIAKIIFVWYLFTGTIIPTEKVDDRQCYSVFFEDGKCVDLAYKGEVLEWIKTDSFEYDEDRED